MNPSLSLLLIGRGQGKPSVFNNIYQNNRSKWFLLCLAARLDGLPQGHGVRMNLMLHQRCLVFDLWQRPTQSSTQLQVCTKDVPLPLPKARGLEGETQEITRLLGGCARGWQCLGVHSLGEFTSLCKISSSFQALQHRFLSCKGPSSADERYPHCSEINRVSRGKGKTKVHK